MVPLESLALALVLILLILVVFLQVRNSKAQSPHAFDGAFSNLAQNLDRLEKTLREEMARNREESGANERLSREEMNRQLLGLIQANDQKMEKLRETIENRLKTLQEDNGRRLEEMRSVVDEKLQSTLEKRLSESFRQVSDRLEQVHKGLGEMQSLASSVGDLKKVLANVKTRGTWGEVQLGNLLDQILTAEQYGKNISTKKGSEDRVEYAIRLPGRETGEEIWLPVDAKFPQEDYQRLVEAYEQGNAALAEEASKSLENRIKGEARNIRDKYLDPPHTTDFGIMFLPTEGLYAEVVRRPGLLDLLQREYRVVPSGPTTFAALLNSLQIGFRTLTIEKRSSEVWNLLGTVKQEFGLFAGILEKTHKKLQEASHTIEDAAKKTRTIERKLKNVEGLTAGEDQEMLETETAPEP